MQISSQYLYRFLNYLAFHPIYYLHHFKQTPPSDSAWKLSLSTPKPNEDPSLRDRWQWLFVIIIDYLDPNKSISLSATVEHATEYFKDFEFDDPNREPIAIIQMVVTLGQQIPFANPAHGKLAEFLIAFCRSEKWLSKTVYVKDGAPDRKTALNCFLELLSMSLLEEVIGPDGRAEEGEDPMEYVDGSAFVASLIAADSMEEKFMYRAPLFQTNALDEILGSDHSNEPQSVQNAWIMGAAQHVKWSSEKLFRMVCKPGDPALENYKKGLYPIPDVEIPEEPSGSCWPSSERRRQKKEKGERERQREERQKKIEKRVEGKWPHTWDQWQNWKEAFKSAAKNGNYSLACREIAQEAVELMTVQENAWNKAMERTGRA